MDLSKLRRAAIKQLEQNSNDFDKPPESFQELVHELRVQQVELEMLNHELRRAQLELRESRDRFVNLFDFAPVGYVTIDASGQIVEANLTIAKLLGVDRRTFGGQPLSRYVTRDDSMLLHRHLRCLTNDDEKSSGELTLVKTDGSLLRVRLDNISIADDRRFIAITDISENTELVRAKQDSDERLRVICHALPIPIAYADRDGIYQFNNAAHEEWFGISCESITGRPFKDVLGNEVLQIVNSRIQLALAGNASACRVELPCRESGRRSVDVHYVPFRDKKEVVIGVYELMFDVSASRQFEEERARQTELTAQIGLLSKRQSDVFRLLMNGKSNKMIAFDLDLGMRTVERERHGILRLLGVESINEMLVKFAGLADPDICNESAP